MTFDLLVKNGLIVDGTGAEAYQGDVGISGDRIHVLGDLSAAAGRDAIDATGLVVAPGFIDVHNHASNEMAGGILNIPEAENMVRQGVTSLISGNCGGSPWPLGEHLDAVAQKPIRQNYGLLVGHATLRGQAGVGSQEASPDDLRKMQDLAAQAMEEGAFGMSTGYFPAFVTTGEIMEVSKVVGSAGGVYASHIRTEGEGVLDAIAEAIAIGEGSGCPVQISHIKTYGNRAWGKVDAILELIDQARARGLNVQGDRYPYVASFTGVVSLVPTETRAEAARRGGMGHLRDEDLVEEVRAGIAESLGNLNGPENVVCAPLDPMPEIDGKSLAQVAADRGASPVEVAIDLSTEGGVSCIYFSMNEENLARFITHPAVFAGSDGHLRVLGVGVSHPRNYGTFPRWVGHYGRDRGLLSVQEAVHKCSFMPAEKFGLHDRGCLAPRKYADIAIFSWEQILDRATFENPHQYPDGIPHVIVNGRCAIRDGELQQETHGRVLRSR